MSTHLSRSSLRAGQDSWLAETSANQEVAINRAHGEALAINISLETERALRGNHSYVKVREDANLSFYVLHQPLGVPEDHVKAMQKDKEKYPTLEVYLLDENGKMIDSSYKINDEAPQITQRRIRDNADLRDCITDQAEVARIIEIVKNEGDYPLISYPNPRAWQLYAKYMGKRLPSDNDESQSFLAALPGNTIEEKFTTAGLPFPGYFDADHKRVYGDGEGAFWVSSAPHGDGFQTLWLRRGLRGARNSWTRFDSSSPILRKDKKVST